MSAWARVLAVGLVTAAAGGAAVAGLYLRQDWFAAGTPGQRLYAENCAACHGITLEGQPNWKERLPSGRLPAPPHDESGHTWHHSDKQLFALVKEGLAAISPGYESDMPAFKNTLTDAEITAILDYIKGTWPERERAYQAARTAADR